MNIIQIVSDTFRSDFMGCYGCDWVHTPYLDRFARQAVQFDRAYICSFPTVPARYEFLTGMVAFPTFGWEHNIYQHRRNTRARRYERDCFAAQTMSTACDWLERNYKGSPFFLYVDTFDPHEPWDTPEWYVRRYEEEPWTDPRLDYPKNGPMGDLYTQSEIQHIRNLYAAEMTLVDKWVGRLLEKIEDLGL